MKFFTRNARLQHERDVAFESAERFAAANLRLSDQVDRLAEANIRLTQELIRLSQRQTPVLPEGDVDQPKSTRENDRVVLNDPERQTRPEPGPARVE